MSGIDITAAIDRAIAQAMASDDRIVVIGEDVPALRRTLLAGFGPERVVEAPISESAFLGAGVGAALGGLRPIVEIMFVDFLSVALHQVVNEAAMIGPFSDGRWPVPMMIRAACGGGYGDAGQHEQAMWGLLAGIPGLTVVAPSTPLDAAGLTLSLLDHDGPSILLEHKLLSEMWMAELQELTGRVSRSTCPANLTRSGRMWCSRSPSVTPPSGRTAGRSRCSHLLWEHTGRWRRLRNWSSGAPTAPWSISAPCLRSMLPRCATLHVGVKPWW